MIADEVRVVDVDSHLTELPDLWLSRLPSKWHEHAPQVRFLPERGEEFWFIGGHPTHAAWGHSKANWPFPPPSQPRVFEEVDPSTYDPASRERALTSFGIDSQVLYPNIVGFQLQDILGVNDPAFAIACIAAYNDYVADFSNRTPRRFIPIMALPFWDLAASLSELRRSAALGHQGIVFANRPEVLGAPPLGDAHWDPLWAEAQATGLSINFHIGFGTGFGNNTMVAAEDQEEKKRAPRAESEGTPPPLAEAIERLDNDDGIADYRMDLVRIGNRSLLSNSNALLDLILAGTCEKFPNLNFVSVESGWGYFPFILASADWNWVACGASRSLPKRLLPSEYFRRQCYSTFWFECETVTRTADLFEDNIMFETDFPHTVALMPGAGPNIRSARDTIEENLSSLPRSVLEKILSRNALDVYHVEN